MHRFLLVPLALVLSAYALAQSPIASPQPVTSSMQPGGAASMVARPSPEPVIKSNPPVIKRQETAPQPNINLQVPLPERALIRRIAMIDIPGRPGFKDLEFINGCLVMAHPAASTVDVFSIAKRRVIVQIKDMKGASGVAADQAGARVFVANTDAGEIAVISARTWQVENRIPLKAAPDALLYVPQLDTLYASNWRDHSISVIDAKQGTVLNTVVVDGRPQYLAFDPATKQIFAALEDLRQIAVLDPTLKVLNRFPVAASMPTGLALDSTGRRLYVAVRHAVLELDADSGREIRRVAAPIGIDMLWLDHASGSLYGVASGGTIALIKAGNGVFEAQREYNTDVHGHTIAFDPEKKMIYLPGGRDGRSKLLILRRVEPNEQSPNPEVAKK
jgi:hypothetical protein